MNKFKPLQDSQLFLLPPSVDGFIPNGQLARVISEIAEEINTSSIEAKYSGAEKLSSQNSALPRMSAALRMSVRMEANEKPDWHWY